MPDPPWRNALLAWIVANPFTKLVSLLLAVAVWLYVQGDEIHEERIKALVEWTLPSHLVTTEPLPSSVLLRVRGTRAATRRAAETVVRLPVDLSERGVGEHGVELAAFEPKDLPQSVQLIGVEPPVVQFTLDEEAERKVLVRAELVGQPAEGFIVREALLEPSVIDVRGPRTAVQALREVGTQPIDVSGLVHDTILDVELDLPRGVQLASDVVPSAAIHLVPEVDELTLASVPVYVWGQPSYRAEVAEVSVTLQGPSDQLDDVGADRVVAFVHLPDPATAYRYEARFGPQEGLRVRIVHPGGADVRVTAVEPSMIPVVRP